MRLITLLVCLAALFSSGCGDIYEFAFDPEPEPYNERLQETYEMIQLDDSTAAEVLGLIHSPEHGELLDQSPSVIASTGVGKRKNYKLWFKAVAFDEEDMVARRKYLFISDERPKFLERSLSSVWEGIIFEADMIVPQEVLDEPYANDEARRLAVLREILDRFLSDVGEVQEANQDLYIASRMVNQSIRNVIVFLEDSISRASRLDYSEGVTFSHINMATGQVGMVIDGDRVKLNMAVGSFRKWFDMIHQDDVKR